MMRILIRSVISCIYVLLVSHACSASLCMVKIKLYLFVILVTLRAHSIHLSHGSFSTDEICCHIAI